MQWMILRDRHMYLIMFTYDAIYQDTTLPFPLAERLLLSLFSSASASSPLASSSPRLPPPPLPPLASRSYLLIWTLALEKYGILRKTTQAPLPIAALATDPSTTLSPSLHPVRTGEWIEAVQLGVAAACMSGTKREGAGLAREEEYVAHWLVREGLVVRCKRPRKTISKGRRAYC